MTRVRLLLPALLLGLLLVACGRDGGVLAPPTLDGATLDGGTLLLDGEGFAQIPGGARVTVEACGVTVDAEIVDPTTAVVTLAPGQRVTLELGDRLAADGTAIVAGEGSGDVRIVTGDGREAVLEDAVVCEGGSDGPANRAPVAVITATAPDGDVLAGGDVEGPDPLTVTFDATGSSDPDGDALSYAWAFGGGDVATTAVAERTFAEPGVHEVVLTVTDESGASASATVTVTVHAAPVADVAIVTVFEPGDARPTLRLEPMQEGQEPGWTLTLDASASRGHELEYAWFWGEWTLEEEIPLDGPTWSETRDATGVVTERWFSYLGSDSFEPSSFRLRVTDPWGRSDTIDVHSFLDEPESLLPRPVQLQQEAGDAPDGLRLSWFERASTEEFVAEVETLEPLGPLGDLCTAPTEEEAFAAALFFVPESPEFPDGNVIAIPFGLWNGDTHVPILDMAAMAGEEATCPSLEDAVALADVAVDGSVVRTTIDGRVPGLGTIPLAGAMVGTGGSVETEDVDQIGFPLFGFLGMGSGE